MRKATTVIENYSWKDDGNKNNNNNNNLNNEV
jgi:hypothetical protein